jgi:hypothetical protein
MKTLYKLAAQQNGLNIIYVTLSVYSIDSLTSYFSSFRHDTPSSDTFFISRF